MTGRSTLALLRPLFLMLGLLLGSTVASAHKASDSYLTLDAQGSSTFALQWDIALRDLDRELTLDADGDGRLTWGEVRTRWVDIEQFAWSALQLQAGGRNCTPLAATPAATPRLASHSDGRYAVLSRRFDCGTGGAHRVDYRLFADSDASHRGILRLRASQVSLPPAGGGPGAAKAWERSEGHDRTLVLVPGAGARELPVQAGETPLHTLAEFVGQGLWHIAIGADHILFLLSLLVVAVLVREPGAWAPAPGLQPVLRDVLRVVTAFTVAHSITLALAALNVWDPPSRWVESLIAGSVLLAALNNLRPVVFRGRWLLTFAFGLVHGFGFAGALKDLGLGDGSLLWPLLGFNLGVELGQLLIVAVFMPLAWALRTTPFYRRTVVAAGSLAMAVISLLWLAERLFELDLLTFV
jgi:hypothetical protein